MRSYAKQNIETNLTTIQSYISYLVIFLNLFRSSREVLLSYNLNCVYIYYNWKLKIVSINWDFFKGNEQNLAFVFICFLQVMVLGRTLLYKYRMLKVLLQVRCDRLITFDNTVERIVKQWIMLLFETKCLLIIMNY